MPHMRPAIEPANRIGVSASRDTPTTGRTHDNHVLLYVLSQRLTASLREESLQCERHCSLISRQSQMVPHRTRDEIHGHSGSSNQGSPA
jgi:hypothetical protein